MFVYASHKKDRNYAIFFYYAIFIETKEWMIFANFL